MHSNRVAAGTEAKQQLCMLHTASLAVTKSSYHLARKVRCIHAHQLRLLPILSVLKFPATSNCPDAPDNKPALIAHD